MKTKKSFFACAAAFSLLALSAGCSEKTEILTPSLTLLSDTQITIDAAGGVAFISYSLENPVDGGVVKADVGETEWLGIPDCSKDGVVVINISANDTENKREGEVSVYYDCPSCDAEPVSVKIAQEAKSPAPALSLVSDDVFIVPQEGGRQSLGYIIDNSVDGGELEAKSEEDWIREIDLSEDGFIHFTVPENGTRDYFEGSITLTYIWPGMDSPISVTAEIRQERIELLENAFTIEAFNITDSYARVKTTPLYDDMPYVAQIMTKADFDTYVGEEDNMYGYFMDWVENAAIADGYTVEAYIRMMLHPAGEINDELYNGLSHSTEFVTYAVGIDENAVYLSEFFFGPNFTTEEKQWSGLSVEISAVPAPTSVTASFVPSDLEEYYIPGVVPATVFDSSTDEQIMSDIIAEYGWMLMMQAKRGVAENVQFFELTPETDYYVVAFGLDISSQSYNSSLSKEPFTTLAE